jgi:hypothetical protein
MSMLENKVAGDKNAGNDMIQYVTVVIGGQLFGLPISQVHDVFVPESVTRVPMSAPEVAGCFEPARTYRDRDQHAAPAASAAATGRADDGCRHRIQT